MNAPSLPAAHLLGMSLDCALGRTLEDGVTALRTDAVPVGRIDLTDFDEPLRSAYYRIDDGADLLDPDRLQRLLPPIITAALDAAQLSARQRRVMPVFVGSSCFAIARSEARYAHALRQQTATAMAMPDAGFDAVTRLAAHAAGSRGPTRAWHTACTSAANALLTAQRLLAGGQAEQVLVLGVELANRTSLGGFSSLQLLADTVRPFDATRSGIVLGEGIAAIVLGRTADHSAMRLTGGAANSDLHGVTGAHPDGHALAAVQRRALHHAGRGITDVKAIKAHATGTPANDEAEAGGLRELFPTLPPVCALKPRLGHTLGACGVTELALFAGALRAGFIPATPGCTQPDPALNIHPTTTILPAIAGTYLLNQFGFGGNNTALVLELD